MAITNFIPEVWSARLLDRWIQQVVFAPLVNREYEGEAAKGNTVHITGVVAPQVKNYKANNRTTSADAISDTGIDLLIDQEKSFDFYVDDIDKVQAAGGFGSYTTAAGDSLAEDSDRFIADMMVELGTELTGPVPTDGDDAFDLIRDARKQLRKANVPMVGLVLACNAEFEALLLGADSKLTSFDTSGDNDGLRSATVGSLLGFRIVTTNHLPSVDDPQFVAWAPRAAAYVSQMDQIEAMRAQNKFADRVRGLHVYGGNVIKPEGVVVYGPDGS